MDAAGVVADHAADGATTVGCWIGREGEVEFFGCIADAVEHDAGLDADCPGDRVDCLHAVHVLRKVKDDGGVTALAGERGSCPARQDWGIEGAADGDGGDDVGFITRDDDADGDLSIV